MTQTSTIQALPKFPQLETAAALEQYQIDPLGFMTRCAREYGEVVPIRMDGEVFCLLTNPDLITEVFKDRLLFIKSQDLQMLRGLLGNGLLTSEGDFWQRQRRLSQPMFHMQRISSYGQVMVDYTQQMLHNWQPGQVLNVTDEMMRLTLNIVMKTIFDRDVSDGEAQHIAHALDEAMIWFAGKMAGQNGASTNPFVRWFTALTTGNSEQKAADLRYQNAITLMDETINAMIQQRRQSESTGNDLLGMLMQIEDADDGSRMSDRQLRDELATMMLAGHETTANTLSWTWMLLAQHPEIWTNLRAELTTVLQGRAVTFEDLPQLHYTNWIIKEAMRLYPPVTDASRMATRDCEIGGYHIPKGTTMILSQWVMHRDARYFEQPEEFRPERWANDLEKQLPRGVYFPFSDGPRVCIGKSFALIEAVLILATIAQQFELRLVANHPIDLQPSITLRPKHGIQVQLQTVS